MSVFETKLINGRLATSAGVFDLDIGINEGRIAAMGAWGSLSDAEEVIDVVGRVILPGGIDTHVHAGDSRYSDHVADDDRLGGKQESY